MEEKQLLCVEIKDNIAIVTLNNPPLNLLSVELLSQIRETFSMLGNNKQLRAVILTGSGEKSFCAGMDTNSRHSLPKGGVGAFGENVMNVVENCPLPVIAAINGYALGGGLELALACDIRIVAEEAKVGLVEANLGLIAGWGGTARLPLLIGEGNAKLMFYTAARLTGQEAKEIGLAQKCVPREKLMDTAMELAQLIATKAPMSCTAVKRVFHATRQSSLGAGLMEEAEQNRIVSSSKDVGEGLRALKEKRQPKFENC